jgi:hypothetical protein
MNPLKNQNKFEDKLKKQLDGMETKPTENLWEKLAQSLPEDAFEYKVAGKLDTIKITPDPETWAAIERRLPITVPFYKRRIVLGLAAFIFILGFLSQYLLQNEISLNNNTVNTSTTTQGQKEKDASSIKSNKVLTYARSKNENNTIDADVQYNIPQVKPYLRNSTRSKSAAIGLLAEGRKAKIAKSEGVERLGRNETNNAENQTSQPNENTTSVLQNDIGNNASAPLPNKDVLTVLKQVELPTTANAEKAEKNTLSIDSVKNVISPIAIAYPQAANAENYSMPDEMPSSNYSITAFTGYNMCYNHLVNPNTVGKDFSKNIALRNSVEAPTAEWTGAFLANLHLNAKWYLSSGIILTNFRQDLRFGVQKPVNELYGGEENASYVHNSDSITNGGGQTGIISYSFTEIPFFVSYKFAQKHKFEFEVQGGLSWGILSGANAQMVDQYNVGLLQINSKTDFPPLRNVFFFTIQPMASYKLNSAVNIGVMPTFKTSLNSMVATPYWVQQYPYFVGLNVFIRKRF